MGGISWTWQGVLQKGLAYIVKCSSCKILNLSLCYLPQKGVIRGEILGDGSLVGHISQPTRFFLYVHNCVYPHIKRKCPGKSEI